MQADLARRIAAAVGAEVSVFRTVGGGDINDAYSVELADGRRLFVKTNRAAPPGMFAAEAGGLRWLAEARAVRVPEVIAVAEDFLALEWLERGPRRRGFDEALGRGLARLHRASPGGFGLAADNYIATLPQANHPEPDWIAFWMRQRIEPMVRRAIERRDAPARWASAVARLAARLPDLAGPAEPPARLHGDLWHGNVHATTAGPALIDPAVYGGPREIDLAMLDLFGGLSAAALDAYHEVWPLAPGRDDRVALWQLYPLLVHTVLFGGSYAAQVDAAFGRYL